MHFAEHGSRERARLSVVRPSDCVWEPFQAVLEDRKRVLIMSTVKMKKAAVLSHIPRREACGEKCRRFQMRHEARELALKARFA